MISYIPVSQGRQPACPCSFSWDEPQKQGWIAWSNLSRRGVSWKPPSGWRMSGRVEIRLQLQTYFRRATGTRSYANDLQDMIHILVLLCGTAIQYNKIQQYKDQSTHVETLAYSRHMMHHGLGNQPFLNSSDVNTEGCVHEWASRHRQEEEILPVDRWRGLALRRWDERIGLVNAIILESTVCFQIALSCTGYSRKELWKYIHSLHSCSSLLYLKSWYVRLLFRQLRQKINGAKAHCLKMADSHTRRHYWVDDGIACFKSLSLSNDCNYRKGCVSLAPEAQRIWWWAGVLGGHQGDREEDWGVIVWAPTQQETEGLHEHQHHTYMIYI